MSNARPPELIMKQMPRVAMGGGVLAVGIDTHTLASNVIAWSSLVLFSVL